MEFLLFLLFVLFDFFYAQPYSRYHISSVNQFINIRYYIGLHFYNYKYLSFYRQAGYVQKLGRK